MERDLRRVVNDQVSPYFLSSYTSRLELHHIPETSNPEKTDSNLAYVLDLQVAQIGSLDRFPKASTTMETWKRWGEMYAVLTSTALDPKVK